VLAEPTSESRAQGKKGGEWVYTTHDEADADAVVCAVQARCVSGESRGVCVCVCQVVCAVRARCVWC